MSEKGSRPLFYQFSFKLFFVLLIRTILEFSETFDFFCPLVLKTTDRLMLPVFELL